MDQFRDEIAEEPWRINFREIAEEMRRNNRAAAAAANDDDEEEEDTDEDEDEDADEDDDDDDDDDMFDPVEGEQICQEAMTLLQNRLNLPSRLRDRTMVRFAQQFINNVKDDIHKMLTDTRTVEEGYDGLDSERDTEEEVETAIRCGPGVLAREEERFAMYPIRCLTTMQRLDNTQIVSNVKAVAFVPLLARLAIELNLVSFEKTERGGLLVEDGEGQTVLHDLVLSSNALTRDDDQHDHRVDTTFVAVLMRLRQTNLLSIGDIQHYELVHQLCGSDSHRALQRFRFLTEWYPLSLITRSGMYGRLPLNGRLPLHLSVCPKCCIAEFQLHLDALFRFFPRWKGITALFQKDAFGITSFEMACTTFTRSRVLDVVEEILVRYTATTPTVNIGHALMMAATDNTISLDGVYFLMRRQPATMLSMLRRDTNHSIDNNNNAIVLRRSTRKRKRT